MILNISGRNVNHIYAQVVQYFYHSTIRVESSRNGKVLRCPTPVCATYEKPNERVLFNYYRDANPFFHFMEGLWMMAGHNDVTFLKQFNDGISKYSDDGESLHGAYGRRWIHSFGFDQIADIVEHFKKYRNSRRAVMTMYSPNWDSLTNYDGKDVPCNTQIYFSMRDNCLDMTVTARSNDFIWGALGANAVHMSMLHEFIAHAVGVYQGRMYQFSNDYHMYVDGFSLAGMYDNRLNPLDPYEANGILTFPMVNSGAVGRWMLDCERFVEGEWHDLKDPFWQSVAIPIRRVWDCVATGEYARAGEEITRLRAKDWSLAIWSWLKRRGSSPAAR